MKKSKPRSHNSIILVSLTFIIILYGLYIYLISSHDYNAQPSKPQILVRDDRNYNSFHLEQQNSLVGLIESQAQTIENLLTRLESVEGAHDEAEQLRQQLRVEQEQSKFTLESVQSDIRTSLEAQVESLQRELEIERKKQRSRQMVNVGSIEGTSHTWLSKQSGNSEGLIPPKTPHDQECYDRFSWGLLEKWKQKKQTWCESKSGSKLQSKLVCYPYQQQGKPKISLFCEATNFFIDFGKVQGTAQSKKPSIPQQYLDFGKGATFATCQKTNKFDNGKLMNHMKKQLGGKEFQDNAQLPTSGTYNTIKTPTYLLARDEDCENMFHAMADHLNLYEVVHMLDLNLDDLQVVLWDKHPDTSFKELYQVAFSSNHQIKRQTDYNGIVLFEKLIFHLESPAGQVHVGIMDPWTCRNSELFASFRAHVLKSFNLWNVPPPKKPSVTFSVRRRTDQKNVGRVCANEKELENILKEGNMMDYRVVDLGTKSFREQLEVMRNTNVLVGIHGAGHMHAYFLAEEAVLVELHPPYRLDRHFRNAARMNGKIYFPYRVMKDKISCKGSSDAITINPNEFRNVMDGAVRLARSFHDGLSECGLHCDPNILALNRRLDNLYKSGDGQIKNPKKPRFPC